MHLVTSSNLAQPVTNVNPPILSPSTTTSIADTGSTHHFATINAAVVNKRRTNHPISIHNPNSTFMQSRHEAELAILHLPFAARHVHIVPDLKLLSLISIGQLCDSSCLVHFDATTVTVIYNDIVVLTGHHTPDTLLWHLDLAPVPHQANGAIGSATPAELAVFAHAALFSPALLSTLAAAINKGYLSNFPGLTTKTLQKYPPQSVPMIKGHLHQTRQNQRSTKPTTAEKPIPALLPSEPTDSQDSFPNSESPNVKTHRCYTTVMETTVQIHSNQTGRFVVPSSTGNNYLLIFNDYNSNAILAEPMRTRTSASIVKAYKIVHARLCKAGFRPKLQRLANECSTEYKRNS
jgi:hypothetical protein